MDDRELEESYLDKLDEEKYLRFLSKEKKDKSREITEDYKKEFIQSRERFYGKSTEQMMREFEANEYEGSPEYHSWYRWAKELGYK